MLIGMGDGQAPDKLLRGNIAAAMARRELSQPDVAARMKALGYKWIRQTVGDVQNGRRSLRASELYGLALALETSIATLVAPAAGEDEAVTLPSGVQISAASVRRSAKGQTRGAVRWDGNVPVFPPVGPDGWWQDAGMSSPDDAEDYFTAPVSEQEAD